MKSLYFIVALLSVTLIATELVWTRIFSAEYFYTFAFLILSIAILGMGLGALALRLIKPLNHPSVIGIVLSLSAIFALLSPPLVINLEIEFARLLTSYTMIGKFVAALLLLNSTFFFGGIALAYFFKQQKNDMPKLYTADLAGAGAGVLLVVFSMNYLSTPDTVFISALPLLSAALLYNKRWSKLIPAALILLSIYLCLDAEKYLNNGKAERAEVIYTHWDAMAKVKIYSYDENYRGINIDNAANSPVYKFDGKWDKPDSLKYNFAIDVSYLTKKPGNYSFLSLGAGGGTDVLQALQAGASEVYAVEVNPHVNYLMLQGELAGFSGRLYSDPRVKVITEDARTFIKRYTNKFDIIYSLSSNTFAALASGSFALAENYLFTKEAFIDYWNSLTDNGFMMMEHQFYIPRITAEFIEAMKELGVPAYKNHFAVYKLPKMKREMILISRQPLNDEIRAQAFGNIPQEEDNFSYLLYPAADSIKHNLINKIVETGWEKAAEKSPVDISPSVDDKPFTAQLGLWKNFNWENLKDVKPFEFTGFPLSKTIIAVITAIIILLIVPLNLLPYFKKEDHLKTASWLYFFIIGIAFMFVEVVLIQKYSLFIGASVYSIVSVLTALLIGSAAGSLNSRKFTNKTAFAGIVVLIILNITLFPWLLSKLVFLEMLYRIFISILFILPLGFFMGMPFPKGALLVGELIDWGFAVNGAASVLGSALIIYIAFTFGFNASLIAAASCYAAAYFLLSFQTSRLKT